MNKFWLNAAVAAALLMSTGFAQTVGEREKAQQKRIAQGVASGQLTPKETAKIEHNEARINKEVRTDRRANGGNLTNKEKARINRQQNRTSKEIYNQKHDAQKTGK